MGVDGQIGVAVSGGGYRASAWGMGTLLYLVDTSLHEQVSTVSSVSGGSITNAVLAVDGYRRSSRGEVWETGARLAQRCSGNLVPFLLVLAVHLGSWSAVVVGAAMHRPGVAGVGLAIAVVASVTLARVSGDATFRCPMVWLYLDLVAGVAGWMAFLVGAGRWWLLGLLTLSTLLLFRGTVVGWAIDQSLLRVQNRRARLDDLNEDMDHVLCACDLHGRHHVYFGRDFVYSYRHGLGARGRLPLGAAVQASANLPGAFAPRMMRARPFGFVGGRDGAPVLALTDGGVYDNMADEWLTGYDKRVAAFAKRAENLPEGAGKAATVAMAARLRTRTSSFIVVANASGPLGAKFAWTTFVPLLGEMLALLRVKSILYDNGNSIRRREMVEHFIAGRPRGVLVQIDTDPWEIVTKARKSDDGGKRQRAEDVAAKLDATPGLRKNETKVPVNAATVLYPLPAGRVGMLMQRSYALAMTIGHIHQELPLADPPGIEEFRAMENGVVPAGRREDP